MTISPTPVLFAQPAPGRHPYVGEEHLEEGVLPHQPIDAADLDARGRHRHQKDGDPGVALARLITTGEQEAVVGPVRVRRPDLLPVDDVVIAVTHRLGAQAGQVGPGVGLGKPLAPVDVPPDHGRQEVLLLFVGPVHHDGWAGPVDGP